MANAFGEYTATSKVWLMYLEVKMQKKRNKQDIQKQGSNIQGTAIVFRG